MVYRYEIEVPIGEAGSFEERLQGINADVLSKVERALGVQNLDEAVKPEWDRQVKTAKELVNRFVEETDPEKRARIRAGVKSLITENFFSLILASSDPDWAKAESALVAHLSRFIPDEMPADIKVYQSHKGEKKYWYFKRDVYSILLPEEVSYLIEKYGLADGQPKTNRQIYRELDVDLKGRARFEPVEGGRFTNGFLPVIEMS